MSRWFPLSETDDAFLDSAPLRYRHVVDLPVGPHEAWEALTADDAVVSWTPMITKVRWTSLRPYGVGTTKEVTAGGLATLRERYYRWDEGKRKTFSVTESSLPGFRRFAEDYVVEPTPTGSRFTWTFAIEPSPLLTPALRLSSPLTRLVTRSWARGLVSRLKR